MADECICVREDAIAVNMTCANATGIAKGAVLKMTTPNTAALADGDTDICAGICQSEKIASNGVTSVSVWQRGLFRGVAGVAGVTAGHAIITDASTSSTNRLVNADVNSENIVGRAVTTAASGATFEFELLPMMVNLA